MGCSSCGKKYSGLRNSSRGAAHPVARARRRPLYKKGRRIYYQEEPVVTTATPPIEEVVTNIPTEE